MKNDKAYIFILKLTSFCLSFAFVFNLLLIFTSGSPFSEDLGDVAEVIAEITNDTTVPTVIIDAGHGGTDGGAVSDGGILEKDINLKISLYLAQFCRAYGIPHTLTRTSDTMLGDETGDGKRKMRDLKYRVEFASKYENCIFVSIHQNKFPQKKYSGLQVYYSKNNPDSQLIAEKIQNTTKEYLQKDNNRKSKPAGSNIYILDNLKCPAVLVECGFLSNDEEARLLNTDKYQKALCSVILASIINSVNE